MRKSRIPLRPGKMAESPKSMEELLAVIAEQCKNAGDLALNEAKVEKLPGGKIKVTYTFEQVKAIIKGGGTI